MIADTKLEFFLAHTPQVYGGDIEIKQIPPQNNLFGHQN
jgi:hypothetical protein